MNVEAHVVVLQACAMLSGLLNPFNLFERADSAQRQVRQIWIPEEVLAGEAVRQNVYNPNCYQDTCHMRQISSDFTDLTSITSTKNDFSN